MDTDDRLAKVCSTVSWDQMKESDKLQLFWKEYSIEKLKHAMWWVNNYTMDSVDATALHVQPAVAKTKATVFPCLNLTARSSSTSSLC